MLAVRGGKIHDAVHKVPYIGEIRIENGKILKVLREEELSQCEPLASSAEILDASGLDIWPGFVDAHCHLGLYGSGIGYEGQDGNELNDFLTPHLRAVDGFNPLDPSIKKALEGGVTTVGTGPGSANVLGGTFMAVKTFGKRVDSMILKETVAMKCAFGENPRRVYQSKSISSRMTISAIFREILFRASEYREKLEAAGDDLSKRPAFDIRLESLLPVLRREIPLKAHAHQTNDLFNALRIAKEFNLRITLEHVTEGHLIAEELASENVPLAVGPTLGHPTKFELKHKSFETAAILSQAGCPVSIITDSPVIPQDMLSLCAGLAIRAGMDPFEALRAITIRPAEHLGIADRVGSLEAGKDADFVLTSGSPFELDSRICGVYIEGVRRA